MALWAQVTPKRIVSLAPNLTEMVYDIGAQDLLVGDSDFCKFPPAAKKLEKVGGWINPNYEKIVSLRPDLVLGLKFGGKTLENLQKLGIPVLAIDCQTAEDVLAAYDLLGKKLGRMSLARIAKHKLQERLENVRSLARKGHPVSILLLVDRTPGSLGQLYGVGPKNFADEMIRWAGGVNLMADSPIPYPLVSKEQLLKRDPDLIINSLPESSGPRDLEQEKKVWDQLPSLKAVKTGRIYFFQRDDYLIPGPTMVGLAEYLAGLIQATAPKP
jgi:iron complex transport system substrate-binding protein